MKCLETKVFSNGMNKKVKSLRLGAYDIEYSNCTKEQVRYEMDKLNKIFDCVLLLGYTWSITGGSYKVQCYNMKEKYKKILDKEIYS